MLQSHIQDETLGTGDFGSPGTPSSPPMKPRGLSTFDKYAQPEPPRPLKVSEPSISFDSTLPPINKNGMRSGDPQLLYLLDNGKNPEISSFAATQSLPPIDDDCDSLRWHGHPRVTPEPDGRVGAGGRDNGRDCKTPRPKNKSLIDLAAGALHEAALAAVDPPKRESERSSVQDISTSTRHLRIQDDMPRGGNEASEFRPARVDARDPISIQPGTGLAPIVPPNSGGNDRALPSIRSIPGVGDMKHPPSDHDSFSRHARGINYPQSPPPGPPHLPPLSAGHGSPPISPPDSYQRSLPSPQSLPATSPYNPYINTQTHLFTPEYSTTPAAPDSTGNGQGGTPQSGERMYINGTYGSTTQPATYQCDFQGCKAPPFQTQYLLNSHANVHSQARPHYCPVAGCSRSEGGKGFKRKNEMIRHGLVHESPGYICPFCPEKDHRYPRPDNLQRYILASSPDQAALFSDTLLDTSASITLTKIKTILN